MERGRAGLTLTGVPGKPEPGRHCTGTSGGLLSAYGVPIGFPPADPPSCGRKRV